MIATSPGKSINAGIMEDNAVTRWAAVAGVAKADMKEAAN
jgi:hypothetical protein